MLNKIASRILGKLERLSGKYFESLQSKAINENLSKVYGHAISKQEAKPIDALGNKIPWFTYPALEFIETLDLSSSNVFEWGSGHSSTFFAERAKSIISIESDEEWYKYGLSKLAANQSLYLKDDASYPGSILEQQSAFDVIIIDGILRSECSRYAHDKLTSAGVIIFDNSDWWPKACQYLRDQGLIQVDFHGFGPINDYTWTTSIFLQKGESILGNRISGHRMLSKAGLDQHSKHDC